MPKASGGRSSGTFGKNIMLFVFPMWDSESERLGKKECTPKGYSLHVIAELIGFLGLLSLIGLILYFGLCLFFYSLPQPSGWVFLIPFGIGIIAEFLFGYSWHLAKKKSFSYDGKTRTATWCENGAEKTYKWTK